ncbi:RagB/SusD family nutrient uptake outer membrane protein [Bacteroides salyersiae]|uniref:RagB/SusD family nutrient uptake outer membrane protein n=1 Tax=Bacteroides salyersiae TaxID=291644 RepID=UPI00189832A1|nr:RagB/SusD family nutrient uptake outer membrane protein [Bacteroides salyersiae]
MKLKRKIIGLCCLLPLFSSCNDFFNIQDESAINPEIWNSKQSAMLYVNNIYTLCLPSFGGDYVYGNIRPTACSDEVGGDINGLLEGTLGFGKVSAFSADNYKAIRYINIAFDELKNSSMREADYNSIAGQLYFLRAWQHWRMILMHGGVPYMKEVVDYLSEDDLKNAKRDKTSDCITYLKEDLENAITMLPASWDASEWGRVTRATAASLLGRILLFYASPQFTPDQNSELAKTRWKEAYDANMRAVAICKEDGYGLMDCTTDVSEQWPVKVDINKLFFVKDNTNKEALFFRIYDDNNNAHTYENSVRPGKQTGGASKPSNMPSLKLVMAFPNADGTVYTKDAKNLYFWKDRDPRFYSTIVYNGAYLPYAGNSGYRQWTYKGGDQSGTSAATSTGYYCRKMLNPLTVNFSKTSTTWIELRYAEVLLNLAESAYEVGDELTMYDCLGQLRERAGIPEGDFYYGLKVPTDMSKIELIMNERMIELAFEGKRFYDLRRRNMFSEDLGNVTKKLNGEKKRTWGVQYSLKLGVNASKFEKERDDMDMDEVTSNMRVSQNAAGPTESAIDYKCKITEEELRNTTTGSYNFFDLTDGILTRSPAIQQTMGWSYDEARGYFNPFE